MGVYLKRMSDIMVCKVFWLYFTECKWSIDDGHLRDHYSEYTPANTLIKFYESGQALTHSHTVGKATHDIFISKKF